ncbi:MAG: hypothetical protein IPM82_14530 [Saprospiraceae bacterium]|nr:hypothetical protein [Saprospiraceae bacterium]
MRFIAITACMLLAYATTKAQIAASQLLATAWDDPAIQRHREQQAYLQNTDFTMPLLRKLELRTETRDLDPKQQEYAVRLSTNGFGMRRTQSGVYNSMKELNETERALLVQEELLARYELLLDLHFDQRSLALLEAQKQVLMDKKTVFAQQFSLGLELDLDDFFRTEEDLLQLERKINEVTAKRPGRQFLTALFTGKTDSIATGNLIKPAELLALANTNLDAVLPPSVKREQLRAQLATLEEEMERMEGRNLLNYLQFRYTGNANDLLEDRFSIGAGVNLPWPNGSKLREQELHLKSLEAQAEADNEHQAVQRSVSILLNEVGSYFQQYLLLERQIGEFKELYSPQRLHAGGLENPETLLRVEESLLKLQLEQVEVEKNLYQSYVGLLNEAGLLSQAPARNWLSPEMELIGR